MQILEISSRAFKRVFTNFLAKFGDDTAENGPLKVCHKTAKRSKKNVKKRRHGRGRHEPLVLVDDADDHGVLVDVQAVLEPLAVQPEVRGVLCIFQLVSNWLIIFDKL